jgi:hypothetical protein
VEELDPKGNWSAAVAVWLSEILNLQVQITLSQEAESALEVVTEAVAESAVPVAISGQRVLDQTENLRFCWTHLDVETLIWSSSVGKRLQPKVFKEHVLVSARFRSLNRSRHR